MSTVRPEEILTARERQRRREEAEIAAINRSWMECLGARAKEEAGAHIYGSALASLARGHEIRILRAEKSPPPSQEKLAVVARHIEQIIAAKNPQTGEIIARADRVVSLVDVLHKDKLLAMDLWHAASRYRDLFLTYSGQSKGVSSYGDYVAASPASQRNGISEYQTRAGDELKAATVAAFGTFNIDRKWTLDTQLMEFVIPAIVCDKKDITQGAIGRQRSQYTGSAQLPAAGAQSIVETLYRLALHFKYREQEEHRSSR